MIDGCAIVFLDLTKFTSLTDSHGDEGAVGVTDWFIDAVDCAGRSPFRNVPAASRKDP